METQLEFLKERTVDLENRLRSVEKQIWIAFGAAGVLNFLLNHIWK